ncbi:integrase [Clostridioides sp. ZZV15-6597]|uniref:integrase n=1 Tax=Clostridioides sp. ZZV15-6597 TaxID=2811500 RepID=UPI001D11F65F|nr:integrase [Clostridioides sp. ZZV15-6597]
MLWDDLKSKDIKDIVNYINEKLSSGDSLTKISVELKASESSIRKFLTTRGYKRVNDKFIYFGEKGMINKKDKSKPSEMTNLIIDGDKVHNLVSSKQFQENMMSLIRDYGKIQKVLKWFSEDYEKIQNILKWFSEKNIDEIIQVEEKNIIKIDLPSKKTVRKTFRLNEEARDAFDTFCGQNHEYQKTDLLSMALFEYIEKYSK